MRVLVCDDSALMRKVITQIVESEPGWSVVGTARNGREAVDKAKLLKPDAITMDIEMPELDGLSALGRIMQESPAPVLMFSSLTTEGSHATLRALRLGAVDFLTKDPAQAGSGEMRDSLIRRLKGLAESRVRRGGPAAAPPAAPRALPAFRAAQFDVVLVGSSTGGPPVLETILSALPAGLSAPVLVAQHMPLLFTRSLAERLDRVCALRVSLATDGMALKRGTITVAPGGSHLRVRRGAEGLVAEVSPEPSSALYKPSVDELFFSGARSAGARCLGVVLTGMGEDGLQGGRELVSRGGLIMAQDAETSVVYGMPRAVTAARLTCASLSPPQIAEALSQLVVGRSGCAVGKAG